MPNYGIQLQHCQYIEQFILPVLPFKYPSRQPNFSAYNMKGHFNTITEHLGRCHNPGMEGPQSAGYFIQVVGTHVGVHCRGLFLFFNCPSPYSERFLANLQCLNDAA